MAQASCLPKSITITMTITKKDLRFDECTPLACDEAWLFDLYPQAGEMVLWFALADGRRLRLREPFEPLFFAGPPEDGGRFDPDALRRAVARLRGLEWVGPTIRTDFWTDRPREVVAIRVTDLERCGANLRTLARRLPTVDYYNCDVAPEILYCYERGVFPLARCEISWRGDRLEACRVRDDPLDTSFVMPPLRVAELAGEGLGLGRHPRLGALSLTSDGSTTVWDEGSAPDMIASLREQLRRDDPDLIWTNGGDSALMPALFAIAAQCNMETGLDREPGVARRIVTEGRTYTSYGRILYQSPDYPLLGRWHLDRRNSFWVSETGLEGLIEIARMAKIPAQRAARRSIGTGISSIELDRAWRAGYLVPWKKSRPEMWKSAAALIRSDRGGLVYQPIVGVYEDVIELDFVSMYPSIMVGRNVSPETLGCACCPPAPDVPELGYSICRRRRGLVPQAIAPIIEKRNTYKKLRQATDDDEAYARYDARQGALKWLLVCCFGYLGYRNARFGRIEAHETTCAFAREMLLRAREVCEDYGFRVLHAIVDCVWIQRARVSDEEVAALCEEINRATGLNIAIEGRYRWIAFLASRQNPEAPVPNRYFGCMRGGKLKYRGIELRRSDQAPFVKEVQGELLECLRDVESLAEVRAMEPELAEVVQRAEERLRNREVPIDQLLLRRRMSREAEEYTGNNMTAVAARQARRWGASPHAGETIRFLVTAAGDPDPDARLRVTGLLQPEDTYDVAYYTEQLRRAASTILYPLATNEA